MEIREIISDIIVFIGIAFMLFGVVGIFRFKNFYPRILVTSKVDTVGALTLMIGLMIRHGFSFFSGKILLIVIIMLVLNPLVAHIVARSAYLSGHEIENLK